MPVPDYGGPNTLAETFDPARGEGSFGILAYGACGYTNSDGSLVFAPVRGAGLLPAFLALIATCAGPCSHESCVHPSDRQALQLVLFDMINLPPYALCHTTLQEMYAAAADANVDYPGSCGRCYEVRCADGQVYGECLLQAR